MNAINRKFIIVFISQLASTFKAHHSSAIGYLVPLRLVEVVAKVQVGFVSCLHDRVV